MKKILSFLLVCSCIICSNSQAQVLKQIGERTKEKVKQRVEAKADQTIDKGLDKAEEKIDNAGKKKPRKNKKSQPQQNNTGDEDENGQSGESQNSTENGGNTQSGGSNNKPSAKNNAGLKVDSKFDFVPGDKIVLFEDFGKENLGDFPGKWITNGTGEIVKINGSDGNYLKVTKEVIFYPSVLKPLPDEFTLECDLMCNEDFNYYSYEFAIGLTNAKNLKTQWNYFGRFGHGGENNSRVEMLLHPNDEGNKEGLTYFVATHKTQESLRNNANQNQLSVRAGNTKVHISIWRQKQRVRIYLNDKKVWDIPNAFETNILVNSIYFRSNGTDNDNDAYFLSNIKLATGNPNTQQKLLAEGKFSTSGILFDVNSDRIKPQCYGAVKEIANVLNENPNVKVKIVGHTDNDGDDAANLDLSKRRAAAVKNMLMNTFNVNAGRMETDGKGETQPQAANDTPENKAQNRRVEFIKF
jgi:OmpA-OmpF porin, OOP family